MIDFNLTEEHELIRTTAARFAAEQLRPHERNGPIITNGIRAQGVRAGGLRAARSSELVLDGAAVERSS